VKLTGKKPSDNLYKQYNGFWSGLKHTKAGDLRARNPDVMVKLAVRGMLPKNHLCRGMLGRLKVYPAESHPHAAQMPQALELK
jgi:large subunit ribosomal protein L13